MHFLSLRSTGVARFLTSFLAGCDHVTVLANEMFMKVSYVQILGHVLKRKRCALTVRHAAFLVTGMQT